MVSLMATVSLDLLTVEEVAELLRVNPQTVRNWIDSGQLPSLRVGARRVRVQRGALESFVGVKPDAPNAGGPPASAALAGTPAPLDSDAVADALDQVAAGLAALARAVRGGQSASIQADTPTS